MFFPLHFLKALTITPDTAVVLLAVATAISASVPLRDMVGTIFSAGIVAYIIHTWAASSNRER